MLESVAGSPHPLPQFHNSAGVNLRSVGRVAWRCTVVTPPPVHQLKSISITACIHLSSPGHVTVSMFFLLHTTVVHAVMYMIMMDYTK